MLKTILGLLGMGDAPGGPCAMCGQRTSQRVQITPICGRCQDFQRHAVGVLARMQPHRAFPPTDAIEVHAEEIRHDRIGEG